MRLEGRVAVITGAGRGQGRALALLFAREGAKVVVAEINARTGQQTVDVIKKAEGEATLVHSDVGRLTDCERIIQTAVETYDGVDILCNNAGIIDFTPTQDVDEELWDRILDVCLKGAFFLSKLAVADMKRRGGGVIINTSSLGGVLGYPDLGPYSAAKGGLIALTRQMAIDYAADRIRVNAIAPAGVDTPMMRERADFKRDPEGSWRAVAERHPLGRLASAEDIAQAALFLASDEASFITGVVLPVDGGYVAKGVLRSPYVDEDALAEALSRQVE